LNAPKSLKRKFTNLASNSGLLSILAFTPQADASGHLKIDREFLEFVATTLAEFVIRWPGLVALGAVHLLLG